METENKNPVVTIEMASGDQIKIELRPDVAPNTVNNFVSLVEKGFYDGLNFHRVIPNFVIQGGCPEGTGTGGPSYSIKGEFSSNGYTNKLIHKRGVISMARSNHPDSAGSQFFLTVAPTPHLDNNYAGFGVVVSGLDVIDAIVNTPTDMRDRPIEEQRMERVTVDVYGIIYPEPEKLPR